MSVLPPLATADDVAARIKRDLSDAEMGLLEALVVDASAAVRAFTCQDFTQATSTALSLRMNKDLIGGVEVHYVRLPQRPVTAVTALTDLDGNALTYVWQGDDIVWATWFPSQQFPWPLGRFPYRRVLVTYTHGYDSNLIPDIVVGVVCRVAARALGRPADEGQVTQEKIDEYSYRQELQIASAGIGLEPDEKLALKQFRRPVSSIALTG